MFQESDGAGGGPKPSGRGGERERPVNQWVSPGPPPPEASLCGHVMTRTGSWDCDH